MTREEIRAMWARWSHRSDLAADLDTIEALAVERVRDRFMAWGMVFDSDGALDTMMSDAPALFCAAGLMEIHRLAEDDAGLSREGTIFEGAASDYLMRVSLRKGPAVIGKRSYPDGN